MERKVGEIFEFEGVKLQAVKKNKSRGILRCGNCYFFDDINGCANQKCLVSQRKDSTPVKFIIVGD